MAYIIYPPISHHIYDSIKLDIYKFCQNNVLSKNLPIGNTERELYWGIVYAHFSIFDSTNKIPAITKELWANNE
jgi:hypothetical protein